MAAWMRSPTSPKNSISEMPTVVLDACILFQGKLTDFLLCLAEQGGYEPLWSDDIHAEWMRNLRACFNIPIERLEYRRSEMERAFPAANCLADPSILAEVTALCRNDRQRKDAHVIATAATASADMILTHNSQDFPMDILEKHGLTRMKPDAFRQGQLSANPPLVIAAAKAHRQSMKRSPYSQEHYLVLLASEKVGLSGLVELLRPYVSQI